MSIRSKKPFAGYLASGFALFLAFVYAGTAHAADTVHAIEKPAQATVGIAKTAMPTSIRDHHPRDNTFMRRQWGVEVLYVRQTGAGYMLEFRYKVHDAEKAKALFKRQTKPLLTHIESGAKFIVPTPAKTGALRNSNPPLVGHTYWMFFANPGKLVKPGHHVNIKIGDYLAENLIVL